MIRQKQFILKSQLARAMGISPSTLKRMMIKHENELKKLDPFYTRKSLLLTPKITSYLIEINGFEWIEIISNLEKL